MYSVDCVKLRIKKDQGIPERLILLIDDQSNLGLKQLIAAAFTLLQIWTKAGCHKKQTFPDRLLKPIYFYYCCDPIAILTN